MDAPADNADITDYKEHLDDDAVKLFADDLNEQFSGLHQITPDEYDEQYEKDRELWRVILQGSHETMANQYPGLAAGMDAIGEGFSWTIDKAADGLVWSSDKYNVALNGYHLTDAEKADIHRNETIVLNIATFFIPVPGGAALGAAGSAARSSARATAAVSKLDKAEESLLRFSATAPRGTEALLAITKLLDSAVADAARVRHPGLLNPSVQFSERVSDLRIQLNLANSKVVADVEQQRLIQLMQTDRAAGHAAIKAALIKAETNLSNDVRQTLYELDSLLGKSPRGLTILPFDQSVSRYASIDDFWRASEETRALTAGAYQAGLNLERHGLFTVAAHGTKGLSWAGTESLSPEALASLIGRSGWNGQDIFLLSCEGANGFDASVAGRLANILKVNVYAGDRVVVAPLDGVPGLTSYISTSEGLVRSQKPGRWFKFTADGRQLEVNPSFLGYHPHWPAPSAPLKPAKSGRRGASQP